MLCVILAGFYTYVERENVSVCANVFLRVWDTDQVKLIISMD